MYCITTTTTTILPRCQVTSAAAADDITHKSSDIVTMSDANCVLERVWFLAILGNRVAINLKMKMSAAAAMRRFLAGNRVI